MSTRSEAVRVGDVLSLRRREITIDPMEEYRLIGIYSFGKGIFHREPAAGSELGAYRFFAVEPNDLVLSNIQAWEGAIGYAAEADAGTIGTHRFLTYTPASERIDANWARWFFLSEPGMALIRGAAPGSTMRNRTLSIARFEALEIPLPPVEEQRRIATRLDHARHRVSTAARSHVRARSLDRTLIDSAIARVLERGIASGWPVLALGDVAEVNPRRDPIPPTASVMFVPMAAVDARSGIVGAADRRIAGEIQPGYKQFRRGDVIFARITPCMQNGKTAIIDGTTSHGYGSTEFHVVRAGPSVQARWLHMVLRTHDFRRTAAMRMTGTAGQQRVSAEFMRTAPIPIPSLKGQEDALIEVDRYVRRWSEIERLRRQGSDLLAAIEPALVNQSFAGLL